MKSAWKSVKGPYRMILRFLREYWQFSLAAIALITGLFLQLFKVPEAAHVVLGGTALILAVPVLHGMWNDLRTGRYGIDILALTAIITSVILHEYWAAIVIVIMFIGGETLEEYAEQRAKSELSSLLKRAPQKAIVERGRKQITIKASQVKVGDKVVVRDGDVAAVDGTILEGEANFDEAAITGESMPQVKKAGDTVLSGSISMDGTVVMRCAHEAKDSQYEQIVRLVRIARSSQAPFVRLADRYSIPFTILAFAIAGIAWFYGGDPKRFLEVIVVATPCPLLLAAPVAIISGMSRATKHGIIIKTGGALERLAKAQAVAFDKTGTLTTGRLQVDKVVALKPSDQTEVLRLAASLEQKSGHVLAQAIVNEAIALKLKPAKLKKIREHSGHGLEALVGSTPVQVGRLSYLESCGVIAPSGFNPSQVQQTATYVAANNILVGYITFSDTLRTDSAETIARLRELGIGNILMVTGDHQASADSIAKQVGIYARNVTAGALPADKLHAVEKVVERPLVFVGDGVNDAPVLTAADVGIALGAKGSAAASETADVVIMLDDINRVARAVEIAKATFRVARQSIWIGIGLSVVLMLIFSTGKLSALTGAILQEFVDVAVILGALRAHGEWHRRHEASTEDEPVPA